MFQRLDSLDLLRGVAILGIFLMNTWTFSLPQDAYVNLNAYTTDWVPGTGFPADHELVHGADFITYVVIHLVADMKFITMFSMLFGAGILLQGERAAARGLSPARIHYRRMGVLLIFGLIHAYALWYGDILYTYALCGMLLFPLHKARPALLLSLGVLMVGMATFLNLAWQAGWSFGPFDVLQDLSTALDHSGNDLELTAYRGGWWQQMDHRFWASLGSQTTGFLEWSLWRCGGCILIGMALHRLNFFRGAWRRSTYAAIAALAIPIGWAITASGIVFNETIRWDETSDSLYNVWGYGVEFNYWGSLVTELGYLGLGVLVAVWAAAPARAFLHQCLWPLRAIGRTALSNYIAQSLIATTIFYGHGFGLYGSLTRLQLLYVVVPVWALQLIISPIYLRCFRQGPLEWLWHRLVYWHGEPPPLKCAAEIHPA
jgi:uncharacterized protein